MKLFYSPDYVAAAESFDTTRKSGWIAESLVADPIDGVEIVAPRPVTYDEIAAELHIPISDVKSHLFRARKMVAEKLHASDRLAAERIQGSRDKRPGPD